MRPVPNDITGERFGRLRVVGRTEKHYGYWDCVCDCGNKRSVKYHNLIRGASQSCGCLRREQRETWSRHRGKLDDTRMPWPDWYFESNPPSPCSPLATIIKQAI